MKAVVNPLNSAYVRYRTAAPPAEIKDKNGNLVRGVLRFATNAETDRALRQAIEDSIVKDKDGKLSDTKSAPMGPSYYEASEDYNPVTENCADYVEEMLSSVVDGWVWDWSSWPDKNFEGLRGQKELQKRISDHGARLHAAAVAQREREAAAQAVKSAGRANRGR